MRTAVVVVALVIAFGILKGVANDSWMPGSAQIIRRVVAVSIGDIRSPDSYSHAEHLFNEHFPYRNELRRAKAFVDYYLFRSSPVPEVHVGPGGWLNYRDELNDFRKTACNEAQAMQDLARRLHQLEKLVEASGRTFLFMVAPNKSTIYPEYVGLSRSATCGKSRYDLLLEALREYPVKNFVRLDGLFLEAKQRARVYYRTDTHWNEEGALLVARAVLQRLSPHGWRAYLGEGKMTTASYSGDLARMMGLTVNEVVPALWVTLLKATSTEDRRLGAPDVLHTRVSPSVASIGVTPLPRAVVYHDSFMRVPLALLGGAFEQIDAYWADITMDVRIPLAGSEEALKGSEIIMVEVVERNLANLKIDVSAFSEVLGK